MIFIKKFGHCIILWVLLTTEMEFNCKKNVWLIHKVKNLLLYFKKTIQITYKIDFSSVKKKKIFLKYSNLYSVIDSKAFQVLPKIIKEKCLNFPLKNYYSTKIIIIWKIKIKRFTLLKSTQHDTTRNLSLF